MIKAVVIHQPNFLPRLKVFIKIAISDIWLYMMMFSMYAENGKTEYI